MIAGIKKSFMLAVVGVFAVSAAGAGHLEDKLAVRVGTSDAVFLKSAAGRVLFARNAGTPLVPASIIKIATSLAAFDCLGEEHRFKTEFYATPAGDLLIKGFGDPCFVSSEIKRAAETVAEKMERVGAIVVDDSFFSDDIQIPGRSSSRSWQPYDAPNGALCANFNTVAFVRENGRYCSAEPETPLLPFAEKHLDGVPVSGGRVLLVCDQKEAAAYTGRLFAWFLEKAGCPVTGPVKRGVVNPAQDRLVYRQRSCYTLEEIVDRLMCYSNNFTANQLLLACGAKRYGSPANLAKGVRFFRHYLREKVGMENFQINEGAGLSRGNRVTAAGMDKVLQAFSPYHKTLRRKGFEFYKTGTLDGVDTRAGYLINDRGKRYRYVVMVNTPGRNAGPVMRLIRRMAGVKD